jgi:hypothetical protein
MTPMNADEVLSTIRQRGTKFATVTFLKKDGTPRKINGLFRATSHMVGSDRGQAHGEAMKARQQVAIYSLKDRGWRSFFADSVVSIN